MSIYGNIMVRCKFVETCEEGKRRETLSLMIIS